MRIPQPEAPCAAWMPSPPADHPMAIARCGSFASRCLHPMIGDHFPCIALD